MGGAGANKVDRRRVLVLEGETQSYDLYGAGDRLGWLGPVWQLDCDYHHRFLLGDVACIIIIIILQMVAG